MDETSTQLLLQLRDCDFAKVDIVTWPIPDLRALWKLVDLEYAKLNDNSEHLSITPKGREYLRQNVPTCSQGFDFTED